MQGKEPLVVPTWGHLEGKGPGTARHTIQHAGRPPRSGTGPARPLSWAERQKPCFAELATGSFGFPGNRRGFKLEFYLIIISKTYLPSILPSLRCHIKTANGFKGHTLTYTRHTAALQWEGEGQQAILPARELQRAHLPPQRLSNELLGFEALLVFRGCILKSKYYPWIYVSL